jgi:hypothetical protein
MLQASLESLGASVLVLMMVGVCCRIARRIVRVMMVEMSESEMLVDHRACILARRSRPYATVMKVGRFVVKEYLQVMCWEGII